MAKWKPIASAPKDGRLILGYDDKMQDTTKHAKFYIGAHVDSDGYEYRGSMYEVICWIKASRTRLCQRPDGLYENKTVDTSHWARSQGFWSPTHWMPLPELPSSGAGKQK